MIKHLNVIEQVLRFFASCSLCFIENTFAPERLKKLSATALSGQLSSAAHTMFKVVLFQEQSPVQADNLGNFNALLRFKMDHFAGVRVPLSHPEVYLPIVKSPGQILVS